MTPSQLLFWGFCGGGSTVEEFFGVCMRCVSVFEFDLHGEAEWEAGSYEGLEGVRFQG